MARTFYGSMNDAQATAHDEAVLAAQLHLLKEITDTTVPSAVRNYAEAYALLSGLIEKPSGSVKG